MGATLLNIQRMGARGVMRGGWRLARAPTSGKSVTETVTRPTHPQPVAPAFLLSAARAPQPMVCLGSASSLDSHGERTCFPQ